MTGLQQRSWIQDRAIFATPFGEINLFNEGGTDFSMYYVLPTGGKDTAALAVGRVKITLTPYNRPIVWAFYAAQTAGGISGHRMVKNARTNPGRTGLLNLTPTQVRSAQLQRGNGKRIYLGKLRLAYAPANNFTGDVDEQEIAVEVSMSAEIQAAGALGGELPSTNWQMVSMGKGTMASTSALTLYQSTITLDAAKLNNHDVLQAVYTDTSGDKHFIRGNAACLSVNDTDEIYSGVTWQQFLANNQGATFQLKHPVTLQLLDNNTQPVEDGHSNFLNVYIGKDTTQTPRAIFYGINQDSQVVYCGKCAMEGETPYGTGQITIRRATLLQAEAGGNFCVVNMDETYPQVVDRRWMGGKKNKSGKFSHKGGKHKGTERLVPLPSAVSKNVTPRYFFYTADSSKRALEYNELFNDQDHPLNMGMRFQWKKFVKDLVQITTVVAEALF